MIATCAGYIWVALFLGACIVAAVGWGTVIVMRATERKKDA
jgi:hypothetical protein